MQIEVIKVSIEGMKNDFSSWLFKKMQSSMNKKGERYLYHCTSKKAAREIEKSNQLKSSNLLGGAITPTIFKPDPRFVYLALGKGSMSAYLRDNGLSIWSGGCEGKLDHCFLAGVKLGTIKNKLSIRRFKVDKQTLKRKNLDLDEDIVKTLLCANIPMALSRRLQKLIELTGYDKHWLNPNLLIQGDANEEKRYAEFVKRFHSKDVNIMRAKKMLIKSLVLMVEKKSRFYRTELWHSICVRDAVSVAGKARAIRTTDGLFK